MAAVNKSIWRKIILTKLTEEKRYWNFCLRMFVAEVRLSWDYVHNVSSARVAEFNFLTENLDSEC